MQRLIILGALAILLISGGAVFAYSTYKQSRPYPVWVPIPINPQLPVEKQNELAKELESKLSTPEVLTQVSKDLGLTTAWKMASDAQCAAELKKRVFVRIGTKESPTGLTPTIEIGLKGTRKEHLLSEKISMRLMTDVWKILGIKPPQRK